MRPSRAIAVIAPVAFLAVTAPMPRASAAPAFCKTVKAVLEGDAMKNVKKPADAAKGIKALAKALRDGKPPSDVKSAVNDYAATMDKLADGFSHAKSSEVGTVAGRVLKDKKFSAAVVKLATWDAKNCA